MKELDKTHIIIQFVSLGIVLVSFAILIAGSYTIEWFSSFQKLSLYIISVFSFLCTILLLINNWKKFVTISVPFLAISAGNLFLLFSQNSLLTDVSLSNLFTFSVLLISISFAIHIVSNKKNNSRVISPTVLMISSLIAYIAVILGVVVNKAELSMPEYLTVFVISICALCFVISTIIHSRTWKYSNLTFWILFFLSFTTVSCLLTFPIWGLKMVNLSLLSNIFALLGLLVGIVNDIYEKKVAKWKM